MGTTQPIDEGASNCKPHRKNPATVGPENLLSRHYYRDITVIIAVAVAITIAVTITVTIAVAVTIAITIAITVAVTVRKGRYITRFRVKSHTCSIQIDI